VGRIIAWPLPLLAGCAAVTGLDSIRESPCAPDCGEAGEATPGDGRDAQGHDATAGVPVELRSEAGNDTLADSDATADSLGSTGCGPLNVPTNCSACGLSCAPTSSSVTRVTCAGEPDGTGATCSYGCATGWLDCDATTNPPDSNGCECRAPNATVADCCEGSCPMQHDNGLNQSSSLFYDCSASPLQIALDACAAFTGDGAQCHSGECYLDDGGATGDQIVCSDGSPTSCICWEYSGSAPMHVYDSSSAACVCPQGTDATYH
jgi:hypothetical protein